MNKLMFILAVLVLGACAKEEVGVYSIEKDFVYISRTPANISMEDSMYYQNGPTLTKQSYGQTRDTVYFRIAVAGKPSNVARKIRIEEIDFAKAGKKQAVAGVNYIAFDSLDMVEHMIIAADSLGVNVPIVLTYDELTSGTYQSFVLSFKLVATEDFDMMDPKAYSVLEPLYRGQVRFSQAMR